jgi:hypothetical protein
MNSPSSFPPLFFVKRGHGGIAVNLRSLKMDNLEDQERQSDSYGEIEGNNILPSFLS